MVKLTEHFTLYEARCRCGCGIEKSHVPEITEQAQALEAFRAFLNDAEELKHYLEGSPSTEIRLITKSWIRCEAHNEEEGGARKSRHLPSNCDATDVFSPELHASVLYPLAQEFFSTVIYYRGRGFNHVDRRPREGGPVCWVEAPAETQEPARA